MVDAELAALGLTFDDEPVADFGWGNEYADPDGTAKAPKAEMGSKRVEFAYMDLVRAASGCVGKPYGEVMSAVDAAFKAANGDAMTVPAHLVREAIAAKSAGFGALRGACGPVMADSVAWTPTDLAISSSSVTLTCPGSTNLLTGTTTGGLVKVARVAGGRVSSALQAVSMLAVGVDELSTYDENGVPHADLDRTFARAKESLGAIRSSKADLCAVISKGVPTLFPSSHVTATYSLGTFHHSQVSDDATCNISRLALAACAMTRVSFETRCLFDAVQLDRKFVPRIHAFEPEAMYLAGTLNLARNLVDDEVVAAAPANVDTIGRGVIWVDESGTMVALAPKDALVDAIDTWEGEAPVARFIAALGASTVRGKRGLKDDVIISDKVAHRVGSSISTGFAASRLDFRDRKILGMAFVVDHIARCAPMLFTDKVAAAYKMRKKHIRVRKMVDGMVELVDDVVAGKLPIRVKSFADSVQEILISSLRAFLGKEYSDDLVGTLRRSFARMDETITAAFVLACRVKHRDIVEDITDVAAAAQWSVDLYGTSLPMRGVQGHSEFLAKYPKIAETHESIISETLGLEDMTEEDELDPEFNYADAVYETLDTLDAAEYRGFTKEAAKFMMRAVVPYMPKEPFLDYTSADELDRRPDKNARLAKVKYNIWARARANKQKAVGLREVEGRSVEDERELYKCNAVGSYLTMWLHTAHGEPPDVGCFAARTARRMAVARFGVAVGVAATAGAEAEYVKRLLTVTSRRGYREALDLLVTRLDNLFISENLAYNMSDLVNSCLQAIMYAYGDAFEDVVTVEARRAQRGHDTIAGAVAAMSKPPEGPQRSAAAPARTGASRFADIEIDADAPAVMCVEERSHSMMILGHEDPVFDSFYEDYKDQMGDWSFDEVMCEFQAWKEEEDIAEAPREEPHDPDAIL